MKTLREMMISCIKELGELDVTYRTSNAKVGYVAYLSQLSDKEFLTTYNLVLVAYAAD